MCESFSVNTHQLPFSLSEFVDKCEMDLLQKPPFEFLYPAECRVATVSEKLLASYSEETKQLNREILSNLRNRANVYAIFLRQKSEDSWSAVYVGQSKRKDTRTRLQNHLVKKDERTGAKLANTVESIRSGYTIGVRCILVEPESMREVIEKEIIRRNFQTLPWNRQG